MMESEANGPGPILCAHLLRRVDARLLDLLASLRADEWDLPTVAPQWKVRDVAAHLLDTASRKLSLVRDGWLVERTDEDLPALVNRLNREGVTVYRRLSPGVLISMLRLVCRESAAFHESLDPFGRALFGVSWAGEEGSLNWFDTARELTERWHHQQQIRYATGREGLMIRELYHPVLDCFLRGLPHAYARVDAQQGAAVRVEVPGECGGAWQIRKEPAGWVLVTPAEGWSARIVVPQEIAWRVFTRGIRRCEAELIIRTDGDRDLALHVLEFTAVVG
jgi:uncharacterized protein (TIGR03083 family)